MTGARYPWLMIRKVLLGLTLVVGAACAATGLHDRPQCPPERMAEWQVPAAWYVRELTPDQALKQVVTGNLAVDAIRGRWEALQGEWREGDRYWRYRRPEDQFISSLGWQEGVVLNRGCRQLGFVTTSVQVDTTVSSPRH